MPSAERQQSVFLALALALSAAASGCPRPGCPTTPIQDPEHALRLHRSLRRTVRLVRAEARVDQRGAEGRVRGTVLMLLERPDRLRFDALTQFGPAAVLTSDGERFQLLDLREDRFLEGPASAENIARLLGVAMRGEEVARLLVGDSPRLAGTPTMSCGRGGYRITFEEGDVRQEIVLEARDEDAAPGAQYLRLHRSELFNAEGRTLWRATFDDYRVVRDPADEEGRGVALPHVILFEDPMHDADALVRFRSIEIATEAPPDGAFVQTAPPGVRVERVP
ncbi:MAG: DUF4292 domain-containing protein [Myxococcota bacterium]